MQKPYEIAAKFIELAPRMIRTVKTEIRSVADGRLTHPQYRILANINRGSNTVSQIALDHGVSQPAMSKNVDALVAKGLIERTQLNHDRRQVILSLSTKGSILFRELKRDAAQRLGVKIKNLSSSDQKKLSDVLNDLDELLADIHAKVQSTKEDS